jgi:hypothetical protein
LMRFIIPPALLLVKGQISPVSTDLFSRQLTAPQLKKRESRGLLFRMLGSIQDFPRRLADGLLQIAVAGFGVNHHGI